MSFINHFIWFELWLHNEIFLSRRQCGGHHHLDGADVNTHIQHARQDSLQHNLAATRLVVFHRLTVDVDAGCGASSARRWPDAVLNFGGHGHECLFHIGRVLRRCLKEGDAQLVGVLHCGGGVDHLFRLQITLVANEQLVDVFARVALDFLEPLLHIVERFLVCAIVDDNDAVRTSVVGRRDRSESFLASSIPNLKFDAFAVQFYGLNFEVDSNGGDKARSEGIV